MSNPTFISNCKTMLIPTPLQIEQLSPQAVCLEKFALECDEGMKHIESDLREIFHFNGTFPVIKVQLNSALPDDEEYHIKITADGGLIEAASYRAGIYARETLKQLAVSDCIFPVEIIDRPQLKRRGFHMTVSSIRQGKITDFLRIIDLMGKFKLNTLLLEYNNRFPFTGKHEILRSADALSPDDVRAIEERCTMWGIEIIPLLQCIGHNGHIGVHPEYQHLFEPGAKVVADMQLCPLNDDAFKLFCELAGQIMAVHPNSSYFHIGADETRSLGNCPECAEFAKKYGKGKLYADYINKACKWVKEQNRRPIIWDDMLGHFPEVIPMVDKDAVIFYWDYWATGDTIPFWVGRPAGKFQIADHSINEEDLDEEEKIIFKAFVEKVDMEKTINSSAAAVDFRKYLETGIPGRYQSFPFYNFYCDHGFEVWGAPSCCGDQMDDAYGMPNIMRGRKNIRAFAKKCQSSGSKGIITTSWHNYPPEIFTLGIMDTAQNSWSDK